MKNTLTKVIIAISSVMSACIILISSTMMQARVKGLTSIYPVLLPLAVMFLHWVFARYYIPFEPNESEARKKAAEEAKKYYKKSFWSGSIGLGYVAIFSYVFIWFLMSDIIPEYRYPDNPVPFGITFISIGLLAQVHGHLKFFIEERKNAA